MKESFALRILYGTACGRLFLKILVHPAVSKAAGIYLSSKASKWLVPYYIKRHKIDMRGMEIPPEGFSSFNAFFTRKRTTESFDMTEGHLISPCDGFLTAAPIARQTVLDIKNTRFTLKDLLKDRELADRFDGGSALIFRLTPADYHRYCYIADGKILFHRKIQGKLHCVRPIALRTVPVFAQNSREYEVIRTKRFGMVVQMEIGALLVGKIRNDRAAVSSEHVYKGMEKGYFEFGGSTVIVLLQKGRAYLNENLFERKNDDGEIPVRMGEVVAEKRIH